MSRPSSHLSLKQRHLSHLNSQIAQLHANLLDLNELIGITALQVKYIEKLGMMHGALFMASHVVFENDAITQSNKSNE